MRQAALLFVILLTSASIAADQLAEKWQKRINDAEASYTTAVTKADNARFFAIQKANTDRVKSLKAVLSEATKAGEFDALVALREKIAIAEKEGTGRPKPKNIVKFGGHDYALIEDKVTWHVAKKRCEEMGGHLACLETAAEAEFVIRAAGDHTVWLGATDELTEGDWRWITGPKVTYPMSLDNAGEVDHWAALYHGAVHDGTGGNRWAYVCEWE